MDFMRNIVLLIILFIPFCIHSQIDKYLRKADNALQSNKIYKAKDYFFKAYNIDKENYKTNEGLGLVLGLYIGNYEEAHQYLEKAYHKTPVDTFPDLIYALAKSYQYRGEYKKAYSLFDNLIVKETRDKEHDQYYINDLRKQKEDCLYGEKNKESVFDKNIYVGNVGSNVNTSVGEYVPVITPNNELLFTSRRKDNEKEKASKLDDKPFENIYISRLNDGKPQKPSIYTIPKEVLSTNPNKSHLAIISASTDGKNMFVFQKNKVQELKLDGGKHTAKPLSKKVNFELYQNHASISKDGNTLFFTSQGKNGKGGLDIYKSTKGSDGEWSTPENLGETINTLYDEDSPYLSDDGKTLYFSSKGHPSFGGYDVFKSTLENGTWSTPQNMLNPVNSPGDDIFMVESNNLTSGYFSSSRQGGFGDMDIYKITFLNKFNKECVNSNSTILTFNSKIIDPENITVKFETTIPSNITPIAYQWTFNGKKLPEDKSSITQPISFESKGDSIHVKLIAGCDTCIEPIVICNELVYHIPDEILAKHAPEETGKNPYDTIKFPYLNSKQITAIGFDITPIHFNLNKSNLREDAISILKKNIEVLKQHPETSILIYGFADSRGKEAYNVTLSKKRAQRVKEYLISNGVNKKQIEQVNGKGETFILNKCTEGIECTDPEHEINRRVEFILFSNLSSQPDAVDGREKDPSSSK